ncbi:MAG TPA: peptide chain release factor N(5)-glutamine methyltransferase [Thermoleophilia bacterium]|nr:peptide chain release factor N(5)-glutamine methyltransferase [Thermoleophilia bacterium]HQH20571.1 peptide chain release factor N(5)-glutamine methyltransferase [Thermoleophilia bacterium]
MTAARSVGDMLSQATVSLRENGSRSPRLDAELLLAEALGVGRAELFRDPARVPTHEEAATFEGLLRRRLAHEPVAYILGRRAFRTIELEVTPEVLIPRPETETLVDVALEALRAMPLAGPGPEDEPLALDVGTGSGCVALALAAEDPFVRVVATDVEPAALAVARRNAARLGLARRVEFVLSDLFADVGERPFDLVVSNPPYIPADEYAALEPNVREYEPRRALHGGADGLDLYRRLVPGAALLLRPGGVLALEVGVGQAGAVVDIVGAAGAYEPPGLRHDLSGVPRVVHARRRGRGSG